MGTMCNNRMQLSENSMHVLQERGWE